MYSLIILAFSFIVFARGAAVFPSHAYTDAPLAQSFYPTTNNVSHTMSPRTHANQTQKTSSQQNKSGIVLNRHVTPTKRAADAGNTPAPIGSPSAGTTVHIHDIRDFALLLPRKENEPISDAESDAVAFCVPGSADETCQKFMPAGLIKAAVVTESSDGSYIQITGCLDVSKFPFASDDEGGQFDVRFPNGAQCTFGGYGASFIELIEPNAERFCLRCCATPNDQTSCNSHQDKAGCPGAIPGTYSFPDVTCE